jgi:ELWxxDGT repeat protein
MKTSFWRRSFNSLRRTKPSGRLSRASRRRQSLCLEVLEDRVTLSLVPQMVLDINANTLGSNPNSIVAIGSTTYVIADDGVSGFELWKSDGTAAGTGLVKDINPGGASSVPSWRTNVNGTLFFAADDGTHGPELWKSDGTAAGTVLVKDIYPGSTGTWPAWLTNVNGSLFFTTNDVTYGRELWKSDGSAAGTVLVKDIYPGSGYSSGSEPSSLTNVNGSLFFTAADSTHGRELWKSNGTSAGTMLVKDLNPGSASSIPGWLTNANGTLFFTADDGTHGPELWKSDGTAAGTVLVKDIGAGASGSFPYWLTNVNGTLFFSADDGVHGYELWQSNGTAAGTVLVSDIDAGIGSTPGWLTNVNGTLMFVASDGRHGVELWKSNGTAAGTTLVKDIKTSAFGSDPRSLTDVNGTRFFVADDGVNGLELWKSNDTAAGTTLVKDIYPGSGRPYDYYGISSPNNLTNVNGTLFFSANDGVHGPELWKSDGTAAGTVLVKDINPGSTGSYARFLTNVNGKLFFSAIDGTGAFMLWRSDGTAAGTVKFSSLLGSPSNLTNANGTLFFTASDNSSGQELWKSDGTAAGTTLVKDIYPGTRVEYYYGYYGGRYSRIVVNSSNPTAVTNVNGTLFFTAEDGTNGRELWRSDGTAAGTVLVKDFNPGSTTSYAKYLTNVNGTLFFNANDGTHGPELWKSDGTAAGTVLVKDIYPASTGTWPAWLTNVNGSLFFTTNDVTHGPELWKSDGTVAGTVLVKDVVAGSSSSDPRYLTNVNGTLFFAADDGAGFRKLWQSDGSAPGTVLVTNLAPNWLTNANGMLFFSADDGVHGRELWKLVDGPTQGSLNVRGFPSTITAGVAGSFTVTAKNADGTTNTGYGGTVQFSSSDPQAVLPGNYTFTAADQGVHTFSATLKTAGSQSITTGDTVVPGCTGTQSGITVNAAAASRFTITGFPSPVTAGVAGSFTVAALDPYGNRATGYIGTVRFTSSDAKALLPRNYTFTAADAGMRTFIATLKTAGYRVLTATDTASAALSGAQGSILVTAAAASRLALSAPASVKANAVFSLTVTVVDAYGNIVTDYQGKVSFSSSDSTATLPKKYTFTAADSGVHTFTGLRLKKKGKQTITVTDTLDSSLKASVSIDVG